MSSFEFLSVLISVVVGLGIANLLTGLGRLLQRHREVRVSLAFLVWTLFVFMFHVVYWWTIVFGWQEWQNWNLLVFLFVLTYGILLFLLSVILFPVDMPANWDPHTHFIDLRRWFFGIFVALIVVEALDSYLKNHLAQFSLPYYGMLALWFACAVAGWMSESRRTQAVASLVVLGSMIAWVSYQLRDLEWSLS
ncbi:MAG: hypothetical protein OEW35_04895 [Gammaproteobacteria bacterium]|nr:hypothetical protein [Gammaproteobacteria bacterium]MDH4254284.1 hypothetical protein [Gammaproteobacteria bacterium]MDH5309137.1 hypothetical protein [Gammaproteobacteria bacterium]